MNKELEEAINRIENIAENEICEFSKTIFKGNLYMLKRYIDNSISKEVIEKKIEELNENGYWDYLEERDLEKAINILQELLEGK